MNDMRKEVLDFLGKFIDLNSINEKTNFIEEGLVNSLFAMQLILFLEENFHITVSNEDIKPENFCSIDSIMIYLKNQYMRHEE